MNEITLQCADAPNAPNVNFLATLQPLSTSDEEELPFEITLDRYTREAWSLSKNPDNIQWKSIWFKSVDEKKRLPDFLKFLAQRKKAAYGKFESPYPDEATGDITTALFLVPFEQPPCPKNEAPQGLIYVKILGDERLTKIKPKPILKTQQLAPQRRVHPQQSKPPVRAQGQPSTSSSSKSGGMMGSGMLGNLLGATHRTNQHLNSVPARKKEKQAENFDTLTSGQVITKFRDAIEEQLKHFETSPQTEIKISISLAELTREMDSIDEKSKSFKFHR